MRAAWVVAIAVVGAVALGAGACHEERPLVVGSKKFTESVLLGELATILLADGGVPVRHEAQLGGTRVLWDALVAGRIDAYPEYTGTLCQEILRSPCDRASIDRALAARHLVMTPSLGFADGYALAANRDVATRGRLRSISDLAAHPELRLGFSEEFLARGDGWPALRARYRLPQADVRGLDHDLAWRGLAGGT
ncbi:MAG TPA: glycine betaine ABC transporter substrate-binding protein, partial [Polyangia bacterium]